ncbi:DUF2953 domain-containing protein [Methanobrevibacter sp.]|uniref:DUF2953 domain-containing protein n=1 Tax=Methanobrevibacter sp. TaxID=66852 RepID=UPI0025E51E79|nr:DUF2953 domain-containing protein [Methanobrevibacter sp.]MBQ2832844.1 DUF2953 domain-containing protein [Methanobrevibacter sp.]
MLNILLMIILIIIIFILILLYVGVRIALIYDKKGRKLEGCLKILILRKIKVYSKHYPSEDDKDEDDEEEDESHNVKNIIELAKPCFGYIKEFLKSLNKCIRITKLQNHLIFGLDSYADTAKYIGYIWSLLIVINSAHENSMLTAEPSFNGSVLDAKGENYIDINILKLMPPLIKLLSKKEVRQLIRGIRNG